MKSRMRLLLSAVIAVILIIFTADFGLNAGKQSKIKSEEVREAAQSQVVVQDFIHDNYVISERNPWTDYDLHPVEYKESTSTFRADVKAKAAVLIDIKTKNILYGKNMNEKRSPASTLSRLFKEVEGITISEYRYQYRRQKTPSSDE